MQAEVVVDGYLVAARTEATPSRASGESGSGDSEREVRQCHLVRARARHHAGVNRRRGMWALENSGIEHCETHKAQHRH